MLLLALAMVYPVSSFGEEVIYRGFLMTRLA
jgi:membrane protease YdiL (CAAX protease family)